jgi:RNA polymerase sigma factor (sigma-70 family)
LLRKDSEVFAYLYDNYSQAIYGTIYRIIKNEAVASEVLQDVFLKVWNKSASFDLAKGRLFTWMINIARNASLDKLRSKEIKKDLKTESVDEYVSNNTEDLSNKVIEEHIGIDQWLNKLDDSHRSIFELVYYQGYTHAEVSEELNVPLGTVKTRIRNGLITLRKKLSIE